MTYLPVDEMVRDATALASMFSDGSNPIRDSLTRDIIGHVKALATEYERLRGDLRVLVAWWDASAERVEEGWLVDTFDDGSEIDRIMRGNR